MYRARIALILSLLVSRQIALIDGRQLDEDGLQNHLEYPPCIWHVLPLSIPFLLTFLL
jgi:hypothetical protein